MTHAPSHTRLCVDNMDWRNLLRLATLQWKTDFISSDLSRTSLINIITRIEFCRRETQCDIDTIYDTFYDVLITEMNKAVTKYGSSKHTSKRLKNCSGMKICHSLKEQAFLMCKVIEFVRNALLIEYINAMNLIKH